MKSKFNFSKIPSLAALRCLDAAARHESFTLASEELNLTQSAVSRHIRDVEEHLGFTLFRRTGRRVVLTVAGARFAANITGDLKRLQHTVSMAISTGNEKTGLQIASVPTFAERWLIPRLSRFEELEPEVEISIATRSVPFDFSQESFDLAIHFGHDNWPDAKMVELCTEEIVAVASGPINVENAPLLHLETRPNAWAEWLERANTDHPYPGQGKRFDQFSMIIAAAVQGLGAALLPNYLIESELASGQLHQISPLVWKTNRAYFSATPSGVQNPLVIKFTNWMKQEIKQSQAIRNT
jgi:LysR family transcriptional regulator, glycine cleavage system transcriptional activator